MIGYVNRDSDHQDCPAEGCIECDRSWVPPETRVTMRPLIDIDFKHPDGWVLFRLTRDMGCVRLTPAATTRVGRDHAILNLKVLDRLIAEATALQER